MRVLVLFLAVSLMAVALSGCTGDGGASDNIEIDGGIDPEQFELQAGKGAIHGLVIDDRFRPIPGAEILLQPLGLTTKSTQNGEYAFVDVEPGKYTLRVTAEGHEAVPQTVAVEEGLFSEANIVARRVVNEDGTVITEEYVAFSACQASAPVVTAFCHAALLDQSGDSDRATFRVDYTQFGANVTYLVIEMLTNKQAEDSGAFKIVTRKSSSSGQYYVNEAITEGDYLKVWMKYNETSPFDIEARNHKWMNNEKFDIQIWTQGMFKQETQDAFDDYYCTTVPPGPANLCPVDSRGIGAQFGIQAKFVVTLFLGEPEVDIETYCALC